MAFGVSRWRWRASSTASSAKPSTVAPTQRTGSAFQEHFFSFFCPLATPLHISISPKKNMQGLLSQIVLLPSSLLGYARPIVSNFFAAIVSSWLRTLISQVWRKLRANSRLLGHFWLLALRLPPHSSAPPHEGRCLQRHHRSPPYDPLHFWLLLPCALPQLGSIWASARLFFQGPNVPVPVQF